MVLQDPKDRDRVDREVRVMRNLSNHVAVVRLYEHVETPNFVYIMMEHCTRGWVPAGVVGLMEHCTRGWVSSGVAGFAGGCVGGRCCIVMEHCTQGLRQRGLFCGRCASCNMCKRMDWCGCTVTGASGPC